MLILGGKKKTNFGQSMTNWDKRIISYGDIKQLFMVSNYFAN